MARTVTDVPVPIMLDERRDYQSHIMQKSLDGFKQLISKHSEYVQHRKTRTYDFGGELGERDVDLVVFKPDNVVKDDDSLDLQHDKRRKLVSYSKQQDRAVFFTVNGQVHGDKGLSFIKRDEKMGDLLDELVDRNPALLDFLKDGDRVSGDTSGDGADTRDEYEAPFFPDTLQIIDDNGELWDVEEDGRYEVEAPVDGNGWISFYLNAPDNFFTRDENQGVRIIQPQDVYLSDGLSRGVWTVQLQGLEAAQPGMTLPVQVDVGAEGMESLTAQFNITYVESEEQPDGSATDDDQSWINQLDFPDIIPVYEDEWEDHTEPFDADTPVRIAGGGSDMQIYVNFDAGPIRDFMSRYNFRKTGKEAVKETWKVGVAFYALSTFIEVDEEFPSDLVDPDHVAEVSMRGIVQSMLDQQVSEDELEALTV